jgi:hypothetical protein
MTSRTTTRALEALKIDDAKTIPALVVDVPIRWTGHGYEVLTDNGRVAGYHEAPTHVEELGLGSKVLVHSRGRVREALVWRIGKVRISVVYNTPTDYADAIKSHRQPYPSTLDLNLRDVIAGAPMDAGMADYIGARAEAAELLGKTEGLDAKTVTVLLDRLEAAGAIGLGEQVIDHAVKVLGITREELFGAAVSIDPKLDIELEAQGVGARVAEDRLPIAALEGIIDFDVLTAWTPAGAEWVQRARMGGRGWDHVMAEAYSAGISFGPRLTDYLESHPIDIDRPDADEVAREAHPALSTRRSL